MNPVNGDIYAMNFQGVFTAFVNTSLALRWTAAGRLQTIPSTDVTSSAAVSLDGAVVYVGGATQTSSMEAGYVYAINARSGVLRWTYRAGSGVYSSPVVDAAGKVFIGADDGAIYALTPQGTLSWRYPTGDAVQGSAAINAQGQVVIGSSDRCVYSFAPSQSVPPTAAPTGPSNAPMPTPTGNPALPTPEPSRSPTAVTPSQPTGRPTTATFTLLQVTLIVTGLNVASAVSPQFQAHLDDVVTAALKLNQKLAQVAIMKATTVAISQITATQLVFQIYAPNVSARDLGTALVNAIASGEFSWWLNSDGYYSLNTYGTAVWADVSVNMPSAAPTGPGNGWTVSGSGDNIGALGKCQCRRPLPSAPAVISSPMRPSLWLA